MTRQANRLPNLRHGLRTNALLPWEDAADQSALVREVESYLKPNGEAESEIVRRFAEIMWRLRRVAVAETAHLEAAHKQEEQRQVRAAVTAYRRQCELAAQRGLPCPPEPVVSEVVDEGAAALCGLADARLTLVGRYEAALQRAARRQLFLLSAMRRLRGGELIDHENMEGGERTSEE